MGKKIILIVDDNPLNLRLFNYLLVKCGYQTQLATNAEDALSSIKNNQPDLILMDIQLPGMSGLELTELLKEDKKYKHIPIIAVTAYAMKGDKEIALEKGCDAYLSKPIDTKELPLLIANFLKKK